MKTDIGRMHITDDMGNDVVPGSKLNLEYEALCEVAEAAEEYHRAHCLLLTSDCPICRALAHLDAIELELNRAKSN